MRFLIRAALLFLPAEVRRRHGSEIVATWRQLRADLDGRGALRRLIFDTRTIADIIRSGLRDRLLRRREGLQRYRIAHREDRTRLAGVLTDLRLALRRLRRAPGFALAAVCVLGVGIGADTTVFSALETVLLAAPPYPEPDRLVLINLSLDTPDSSLPRCTEWSYPKFELLLESPDLPVESLAGYGTRDATLTGAGEPVKLTAGVVTPDYFRVLGLQPVTGRFFVEEEGIPGAGCRACVISYALWQSRFGGDTGLPGRSIDLNGVLVTVIGVAPPGFRGLRGRDDAWVPVAAGGELFSPYMLSSPGAHWMNVVARLGAGVSVTEAGQRLAARGRDIEAVYSFGIPDCDVQVAVRSLAEVMTNPASRTAVLTFAGAAGLVLLLALANLAGLFLVRVHRLRREIAVRIAIGAGRWRIVRGMVTEGLLVALAGGGLGVVLALFGTEAMARAWPETYMRSAGMEVMAVDVSRFTVDLSVLGAALILTLTSGVLLGLLPALLVSRRSPADLLRSGHRLSERDAPMGRLPFSRMLVGGQAAITLILLIGAGFLLITMSNLQQVPRGFDPDRLLVTHYDLPLGHPAADDPAVFNDALLDRLRTLPKVEAAAIGQPPLAGLPWWLSDVTAIDGRQIEFQSARPIIGVNIVSEDYFTTLSVPVRAGRVFTRSDRRDTAPVLVINESAARLLFDDPEPLGRTVEIGIGLLSGGSTTEVVGVIGDMLHETPRDGPRAEAYYCHRQVAIRDVTILLRTAGEPLSVLPAVRSQLSELDDRLALYDTTTMAAMDTAATRDTRLILTLLTLFAGCAVLLVAVGVFGVVAFTVNACRRELGIRIALGAGWRQVLERVLAIGLGSIAIGAGLGLAGAVAGARLLSRFLFGIEASDPRIFLAGVLLLLLTAAGACLVPAWEAIRIDPARSLRQE